jgi:hypothetical protein
MIYVYQTFEVFIYNNDFNWSEIVFEISVNVITWISVVVHTLRSQEIMTEYKQDDGDGHSITYLDTDGYTTCTFGKPTEIAKRIREMTNFKCRPDDVFICAPVKSGKCFYFFM